MPRHLTYWPARVVALALILSSFLACYVARSPRQVTTRADRVHTDADRTSLAWPRTLPLAPVRSPKPVIPDAHSCDPIGAGVGLIPDRETRARTRRQIAAIAREMGAGPVARRLLVRWAVRESRAHPGILHTLEPDRDAASSPRARAALASVGREWSPRWGYGRGLYGMQPALYVPRWDASADPDVLCDPVVATIVAVWAARDHARECERAGESPTILVASRRWGSGHCAPRERDAIVAEHWLAKGVDPDTPVRWGNRWPQDTTDRAEIYQHMKVIAEQTS